MKLAFATVEQIADQSDVQATLTFGVPQDSKPYNESNALTGNRPVQHLVNVGHQVRIYDMRPWPMIYP